jgi:hypothetical protein
MNREWAHLKMLKRAGRGHDPEGVNGTREGECAVLCPACPQPGKNLPDNWCDAPSRVQCVFLGATFTISNSAVHRWVYAIYKALDANFRMVRNKVSSEAADPSLGVGFTYFGENMKYINHLELYGNQPVQVS